ncbi:MAG: cadherin-like domain-containing protein [Candidatus Caenarcaniphilales bacterium]|nr:cadherin-like domain-containing protein [Candidatus Caenarcaniphilales bacterium]
MLKKISITILSFMLIMLTASPLKAEAHSCSDEMSIHQHENPAIHEHMSIFNNLVSCSQATVTAIKNGNWFDPSIWDSNKVPETSSHVLIPKDIDVSYGGVSESRLATIRVDGNLNFAPDKDSKIMVETIVTSPGSNLVIGSINNPISADKKVEIIFLDNGVIDLNKDPEQLGRGLIAHGNTIINGQEKTVFLKLKEDALQGDSKIILSKKPKSWNIGDRLVLSATSFESDKGKGFFDRRKSQDEVLHLTGINKINEETFEILIDKALEYNHVGLKKEHKAYLANYSRNIIFKTELKDSFGSYDELPAHRRAHVMFMHGKNVDIRYAEFFELGRTDKSIKMGKSESIDNNFIGRYPFHFHRLGVGVDSKPAIALGNAVWGSPGFAYVHHDSYAIMADNAAYNIFGTAFVAESGNETGLWQDNISIKTIGFRNRAEGHPKEAPGTFDIGRGGIGYWFQSRLVYSFHNIAVSNLGWGFVYFHRPTANTLHVDYQDLDTPEIGRYKFNDLQQYQKQVHIDSPNIQGFEKFNEAIASDVGLEVIKNHPEQHHDKRTILKEFTAWNVNIGVHLDYTGHYILDDIKVYGHPDTKKAKWRSEGIVLSARLIDIVLKNSHIENFQKAVKVSLRSGFDFKDTIILLDVETVNNTVKIDSNLSASSILDTSLSQFPEKDVKLQVSNQSDLNLDNSINIVANKQDSFGEYKLYGFPAESATFRNVFEANFTELKRKAYYTLPNGDKAVIWDEIISDRLTGEVQRYELITKLSGNPEAEAQDGGTLDAKQIDGVWVLDNHAPYATRDFITVADGEKLNNLQDLILANDKDYENDSLELYSIEDPEYGEIVREVDGSYSYKAPENFNGVDYFHYTINDGKHASTAELRSKGLVRIWVDSYFSENTNDDSVSDDGNVEDDSDTNVGTNTISLSLVDAETDSVIESYGNSATEIKINLAEFNSSSFNFIAETNSSENISSVKFTSSLGNKTERAAPYALFGDSSGDYQGKELSTGTYDLKVEVFNGTNILASKSYLIIIEDETNDSDGVVNEPQEIFTVSIKDVITQNILAGYEAIEETVVLDLDILQDKKLNFTTNVNSDSVKAVKYTSSSVKTPDEAIFGIIDGNPLNFNISVFNNAEASGEPLAEKDFNIIFETNTEEPVLEEPEVIEDELPELITLSLVNAETNTVVSNYDDLQSESIIDLDLISLNKVNFIANVDSSILDQVKLVEFKASGLNRNERGAPYTWFGDNNGNFFSKDLSPGVYNLTVNVISKSDELISSRVFNIEIK